MDELSSFLSKVDGMCVNAMTVSKKVLDDGKEEITLNLANKKVMPDRMESPARAHVFHDANGFASYLKSNKSENLLVLIDTKNKRVAAVLDDKAKQGYEVVQFSPPYHPKFTLFEENLLGAFDVKEFAKGVMMCRDLIAGVDGDEKYAGKQLALLMKQITVSNKITAENGTGVECVNGVVIETNVRAGKSEEQTGGKEELKAKFSANASLKLSVGLQYSKGVFHIKTDIDKTLPKKPSGISSAFCSEDPEGQDELCLFSQSGGTREGNPHQMDFIPAKE